MSDFQRFLQPPNASYPSSWPSRTTGLHAALIGSGEQLIATRGRGIGARRRLVGETHQNLFPTLLPS